MVAPCTSNAPEGGDGNAAASAAGVDLTKLQLPCANCRAILNVPPGLHHFSCPQCHAELAVDPAKLGAYMASLGRPLPPPPLPVPPQLPMLPLPNFGDEALKRRAREVMANGIGRATTTTRQPTEEEANEVRWFDSLLDRIAAALDAELEDGDADSHAGETFADYRPWHLALGKPHPDPVVETASLSAVAPPEPSYKLLSGAELATSGALSCLQLETLVYASQRHAQLLPDGARAGFFVGDGAGVGKGRTLAGLVLENWQAGRTKALWLSVGSDLKFDARRDLDDVGAKFVEVHALNKLPYGKLDSKAVGVRSGVVFLTYSSLIAASDSRRTRLQQLVQWCGGTAFDGLLLFDECHKAKNLVPEAGGNSTRTGEAVLELQAKLPGARVVYCSATGASEPRNLGYMVRLGLWGAGTDFPDFLAFLSALEKRGVGALELIAMDMKARGMYVCRTLSFKGAEFEVVEVPLSTRMHEMYSKAAQFWAELRVEIMCALDTIPSEGGSKSPLSVWRHYWATHQRFFRHLCMSAKVVAAVEMAKAALMEGKCAVIGLQSTGEARMEDAVSKYGAELDDFVSGPRELLLKLIEDHYPVPPEPQHLQAAQDGGKRQEAAVKGPGLKRKGRSEAMVSQRGRVRKTVQHRNFESHQHKGEDTDDGDSEPSYLESSEDDSAAGSVEDHEFKICRICANEDDEAELAVCEMCDRAVHPACLAPPIASVPPPGWTCADCTQETAEIVQEREAYLKEVWSRYHAALERRKAILNAVQELDLPNNPLDDIIDQMGGPENVSEMTGRKGMLVRAQNGKGVLYQSRNTKEVSQEMLNMHEKKLFMDGKKLVAVISEAASAGVSLQADRRAQNQRRRVHITLELPWSADKAIQQFGRTHRANQASAPQYRLLFTNLGGERRFASIVAKRLESLGALTQGDRRAGPSLSAYNYDSVWGKKALASMYRSIMELERSSVPPPGCAAGDEDAAKAFFTLARAALVAVAIIRDAAPQVNGYRPSGKFVDSDMHDVARFLNRELGLEPIIQNRLFDYFLSIFEDLVSKARKEGQFDSGIADISAARIELREDTTVVHRDPMSGAPTTHSVLDLDRGCSWEAAQEALARAEAEEGSSCSKNGFYESQNKWLGRHHYLLALKRQNSKSSTIRIIRPSNGESAREMPSSELEQKYVKMTDKEAAQRAWEQDYEASAEQASRTLKCMHGPNCKAGSGCVIGKRVQELHILGGLVFPIWGTLEQALNKQERLAHRKVRVVRLETTKEGKKIVGIHVPNPAIEAVLAGLEKLHLAPQATQNSSPTS
eukprot:SM000036S13262  [mRNA]  locus=s36:226900:240784:+ [translate_table: standard]